MGRQSRSLGQTYQRPFGVYTVSPADVRDWLLARSPLHYERGDMRADYDWMRAMLAAAMAAALVALSLRLVVTATIIALVAADLWLIVTCNLAVKGVVLLAVARRRFHAGLLRPPAFLLRFCHWCRKREADRL
jgi:hypothetical protein